MSTPVRFRSNRRGPEFNDPMGPTRAHASSRPSLFPRRVSALERSGAASERVRDHPSAAAELVTQQSLILRKLGSFSPPSPGRTRDARPRHGADRSRPRRRPDCVAVWRRVRPPSESVSSPPCANAELVLQQSLISRKLGSFAPPNLSRTRAPRPWSRPDRSRPASRTARDAVWRHLGRPSEPVS
jgi:hypothetical protein